MLTYCKKCIMPSTKPDLKFDEEGVCSACRSYENRPEINWDERKKELDSVLDRYRSKDGSHWDCIVPVSGGKDSTYQVIKMLELGMTPLCVCATTCDLSPIGRENLDNIKNLGVDLIEFSPNPKVRKTLNKVGLREVGDISWPEHVGIFTIPIRVAVEYKVPLIIWGENAQNEYGGPAAAQEDQTLDRRWLEEFGGLLGLRVSDLVGIDGIKRKDTIPYLYPSDEDLKSVGVTGIFLGYFIPWDGLRNYFISNAHGFKTTETPVHGTGVNYENLDNHQTGIHDYFKYLKYGFGRATDIACTHLRRGRISRQEALAIAQMHDGKFPWTYLGKSIDDILSPLDMTTDEFISICDQFTNKSIFKVDRAGNLIKDKDGNLSKINCDNV